MAKFIDLDTGLPALLNKVKAWVNSKLSAKQDTLTFDNAPTANSNNPVKSGGVYTALAGKQDTISDLATIRTGAAAGATALQPADVSVESPSTPDGTVTINVGDNAYSINLNHSHPQYLKYQLLADEAAYTALATKDSGTLYLIPVTAS